MLFKAVFLDRDGTINYDPGYLGDPDSVKLYPGVPEILSKLKSLNFKLIVISNQSGISRGLITREQVESVNSRINLILSKNNAEIDEFYYCPYHPDFDEPEKCLCRKPSPQMVLQAAESHKINLNESFFVGDKVIDVECGENAGVKTILMKNSLSEKEINSLQKEGKCPNFVAADFYEMFSFIAGFTGGD